MLVLKDVIKDMKCDYKDAKDNIEKAMRYKLERPNLAQEYFKRSAMDLDKINVVHDDIVDIINEYKKTKGDALEQIMILWDWEHEQMIDGVTEIKQLQDYYKSL